MRNYLVILEPAQGGTWGAYVPDLPGCVALGDTRAETLEAITESVRLHVAGMLEDGDRVPEPTSIGEVVAVEGGPETIADGADN